MRYFYIIISVLLFQTSCTNKTKSDIEGHWLSLKNTVYFENDTIVYGLDSFLFFDTDSIHVTNFKFIENGEQDSLIIHSYLNFDSIIIIEYKSSSTDTFAIEVLNNNTLILSSPYEKYEYSRLNGQKNNQSIRDLTEKMFILSDSIQILDTIEFLNASTVLTYNNRLGRPNNLYNWRLRDYLGYKLLIIDSHEIPMFFIETKDNKQYTLKRNPNDLNEFNMSSIMFSKEFNRDFITGEWSGKSNIPVNIISFKFKKDSVRTNEFSDSEFISETFSLNLTGEKLFYFNKNILDMIYYEVDKISNDSLSVKRLTPIKDSYILTREKNTAGNK